MDRRFWIGALSGILAIGFQQRIDATGIVRDPQDAPTLQDATVPLTTSASGHWIAARGSEGTIQVADLGTGRKIFDLKTNSSTLNELAFSPDGKILASAHSSDRIYVWDTSSGNRVRELRGDRSAFEHVVITSDNSIVAGLGDHSIRIWGATPDARMLEVPGAVKALCGTRPLAAVQRGPWTILIWDWRKNQELWSLTWEPQGDDPRRTTSSSTFSPDGGLFACGMQGGPIYLWDTGSGQKRIVLEGHTGAVTSLSFSSDGRLLASCGGDAAVRLWEVSSGKEIVKQEGGGILGVAFALRDRKLACASRSDVRIKNLAEFIRGDPPADLWDGLAGPEATQAYRSLWALLQKSDAVALLSEKLVPAKDEDIRRHLPDLQSDIPEVRERAVAALGRVGSEALPVLQKAAEGAGAIDLRSRIEDIIAGYAGPLVRAPGLLRRIRSIQALENLGAGDVLRRITKDFAGTREAAEAEASLKRLEAGGR